MLFEHGSTWDVMCKKRQYRLLIKYETRSFPKCQCLRLSSVKVLALHNVSLTRNSDALVVGWVSCPKTAVQERPISTCEKSDFLYPRFPPFPMGLSYMSDLPRHPQHAKQRKSDPTSWRRTIVHDVRTAGKQYTSPTTGKILPAMEIGTHSLVLARFGNSMSNGYLGPPCTCPQKCRRKSTADER